MPDQDKVKVLYDAVSKDYDIGSYDDFNKKLQDPAKRKAFYSGVGQEYHLGSYDEFESKVAPKSGIVSDLQSFAKKVQANPSAYRAVNQVQATNKPFNPHTDKAVVLDTPVTTPTNLPAGDEQEYNYKLKTQEAIKNTLQKNYAKTGQKFDENSPNVQKAVQQFEDLAKNQDITVAQGKDGKPYMVRGEGFLKSLGKSFISSFTSTADAAHLNTITDPAKLAEELNKRSQDSPVVPESAPAGMGSLGETIGGAPKMIGEAMIPVVGEGLMVGDAYQTARARKMEQLYWQGKEQGLGDEEAASKAMKTSLVSALPDAVTALALNRIGGGALKTAENGAKAALKNVVRSVPKVGGIFAGSEAGNIAAQEAAGYDVHDKLEKIIDAFGEGALMDLSFKAIGGAIQLPKYAVSALKEHLSQLPKAVVESELADMGEEGKHISESLQSYENARKKVEGVVPTEHISNYAGLMEKQDKIKKSIQDLEIRKTLLPEPLHGKLDEQIAENQAQVAAIDKQIGKMAKSNDPAAHEVDDLTGEKVGKPIEVKPDEISPQVELNPELPGENSNLANQPEKDGILQPVRKGDNGESAQINSRNEEVASELQGRVRAAQENAGDSGADGKGHEKIDRELDNEVAYKYAKENNLWIPDIYKLGEPFIGGNENTNVLNAEEQKVYKSNNLANSLSLERQFEKVAIHNELFPNSKYEFVGFTGIENTGQGRPYAEPVFRQDYVKDAENANASEISEYMKNRGFEQTGEHKFKRGDIEVSDLRPRNVLKDKEGNLHVIDAEFKRLKKEGDEPIKDHELTSWLEGQSEPTPEDEQILFDNLENLIHHEIDNPTVEGQDEGAVRQPDTPTAEERSGEVESDQANIGEVQEAGTEPSPEPAPTEPATEPTAGDTEPVTGIKNAVKEEERAARGKEPVPSHDTRKQEERFAAVAERVKAGEIDTRAIAKILAEDPNASVFDINGKKLTLEETQNALIYDAADIAKKYNTVIDTLSDPATQLDDGSMLVAMTSKKELEEAQELNDIASKRTGTDLSAGFRARQSMINSRYELVNLVKQFKAANKGKDIPAGMQKLLATQAKEIQETQEALNKIQDEAKENAAKLKIAEDELNELALKYKALQENRKFEKEKRDGKRKETKEVLKKERESLYNQLVHAKNTHEQKLADQGIHKQGISITLTPEMIKIIGKIADNLIRDGIVTIEGLVDDIHENLKDRIEGISKSDIRIAISGYGKKSVLSQDKYDVIRREVNRHGKLITAIEAIRGELTGVKERPAKSGLDRDPVTPETRRLMREAKKALREEGLDIELTEKDPVEKWRSALDAYKTRLDNEFEQLEKIIKDRTFEKLKRKQLELDDEAEKKKIRNQRAKDIIDTERKKIERANRSSLTKLADFIVAFKREAVVANLTSVPKLAAAGFMSTVRKIPEDLVVGSFLDVILPDAISKNALTEGGSPKNQATSVVKGTAKYLGTWRDLLTFRKRSEQLKLVTKGSSDLDAANNAKKHDESFTLYAGRLHGLLKEPTKQASFVTYSERIANNIIRRNEGLPEEKKLDINSDQVKRMISDMAYLAAKRDILTTPNVATKLYRAAIAMLEKNKVGKVAAGMAKIEVPIVTVPTNFANEILKYNYGSVHAVAKTLEVAFTTGFKDIKPEDADYIVRALKKQMVGAAVYGLGYALRSQIGGYDEKANKKKGLKKGHVKFMGVDLPSWLFHNPVFEPLLMGATAGDAVDSGEGFWHGVYEGVVGAVKEVPFIDAPVKLYNDITKGRMSKHFGELAASEIPGVFREWATWQDPVKSTALVYRQPQGALDAIKMNIPWLREQVKTNVERIMELRRNPKEKTDQEIDANQEAKDKREAAFEELCNKLGVEYEPPR